MRFYIYFNPSFILVKALWHSILWLFNASSIPFFISESCFCLLLLFKDVNFGRTKEYGILPVNIICLYNLSIKTDTNIPSFSRIYSACFFISIWTIIETFCFCLIYKFISFNLCMLYCIVFYNTYHRIYLIKFLKSSKKVFFLLLTKYIIKV